MDVWHGYTCSVNPVTGRGAPATNPSSHTPPAPHQVFGQPHFWSADLGRARIVGLSTERYRSNINWWVPCDWLGACRSDAFARNEQGWMATAAYVCVLA